MIKEKEKFTFIHTSKCGGSTIYRLLKDERIPFKYSHLYPVAYDSCERYLLLLRNPIERFVSAFYWRNFLIKENNPEWMTTVDGIHTYDNIDIFCEELYCKNSMLNQSVDNLVNKRYGQNKHPEHCAKGLDYYIGEFVDQLSPRNIIGVVCTETIHSDMKRLFNIDCDKHIRNNSTRKHQPSEQSRYILRKYLQKEYDVIEKLNNKGLLSKKQYDCVT